MFKSNSNKSKLILFLKPYSFTISISILCSLAAIFVDLSVPYIMEKLMDSALKQDFNIFKNYLYISAGLILFSIIISYFNKYSTNYYVFQFTKDIKNFYAKHIQNMPVFNIKKYTSGDLVSRMNNDLPAITNLLSSTPQVIVQPLLLTAALIYMFHISFKLTIATLFLIPLSSIIFDNINKPIQKHSKELMEESSKVTLMLQDIIGGIYILKAFNLKKILTGKFNTVTDEIKDKGLKIDKLNAYLTPVFLALRLIPQLVYPLYGGYLALNKEISLGNLFAYGALISYAFGPVETILNFKGQLRSAKPAVKRIFDILDEPLENTNGKILHYSSTPSPIEFKNVCFEYEKNAKVINNVSFAIPENTTTALVGPSGSGKSSILKLICGFYNTTSGQIKLFDSNINIYNADSVRKYISYMCQENYLYPLTVSENIAIGKPGATMDEIISAAKKANAHDFIMKLPEGYDTFVGERGSKLSGGQCQRISLARIILKDAPIILLDEPTASLDYKSEQLIQEALNKFTVNKTVLIVAHRLSTIKDADNILVLNNGIVEEHGNHNYLLSKKGLYNKLYMNQQVLRNEEATIC